jgi:hypothetical protein
MRMIARLRQLRRIAPNTYRMTLDLVEPKNRDWTGGDCVGRVDLVDDTGGHRAIARGLLGPALDLFHLNGDTPPVGADSRLLWEIGRAVDGAITQVFGSGLLCPGPVGREEGTPERTE